MSSTWLHFDLGIFPPSGLNSFSNLKKQQQFNAEKTTAPPERLGPAGERSAAPAGGQEGGKEADGRAAASTRAPRQTPGPAGSSGAERAGPARPARRRQTPPPPPPQPQPRLSSSEAAEPAPYVTA